MMTELNQTLGGGDLYVPDGAAVGLALGRTTHLGIGAHSDDLEFMALHGILECYGSAERWFGGVTVTDGAGSARTGEYAALSAAEMAELRREEQREAARMGQYAFVLQNGFPSAEVKSAKGRAALVEELTAVLEASRPEVVYVHNPLDRHPTHIGVFLATLEALRRLPAEARPRQVWGCEGWRSLDWVDFPGNGRVSLDVSARPDLARELAAVFASQIAGGKRYDLAVEGRYAANATFSDSHSLDTAARVVYALDLNVLVASEEDPLDWALGAVKRFAEVVRAVYEGNR
jgi:LmbE family N-acetylglucosaminyl deacetylase